MSNSSDKDPSKVDPSQPKRCPADGDIVPPERNELSYFDKLIRYIPGELVAAYLALDGLLQEQLVDHSIVLYWFVFLTLLILTPLYVIYRPTHSDFSEHSKNFHVVAATVAFLVWVFALGGPFAVTWPHLYRPYYGSILLVITTLTIPVLEKMSTKLRFFRLPDKK